MAASLALLAAVSFNGESLPSDVHRYQQPLADLPINLRRAASSLPPVGPEFLLQSVQRPDHCIHAGLQDPPQVTANVVLYPACDFDDPLQKFQALDAGNGSFVLQSVARPTLCVSHYNVRADNKYMERRYAAPAGVIFENQTVLQLDACTGQALDKTFTRHSLTSNVVQLSSTIDPSLCVGAAGPGIVPSVIHLAWDSCVNTTAQQFYTVSNITGVHFDGIYDSP